MRTISCCFFILLLVTVQAFSQIPRTISYQGILCDAAGNPRPDATYNLTFRLYEAETGGTAIWTELKSLQVQRGLFYTLLGSSVPFGAGVTFDKPYWLSIQVATEAELSPRIVLGSVPYSFNAIHANTADVAGGGPWQVSGSDIYYNAGKVGIGTATPSQTLDINGNIGLPTEGIIYSGSSTFIHSRGEGNFFAGTNAGNLTTTGTRNTADGDSALYANFSGSDNTASGYQALYNNYTGNSNTATGCLALRHNLFGDGNTANGAEALYSNGIGGGNTACGRKALYSNGSGGGNTADGDYALWRNTDGVYNTASGAVALSRNTTGWGNTASGALALSLNTTGGYNTASGYQALYANTTGSENTASGHWALYSNATGYGNTASGYFALYSNTQGMYNTASGVQTLYGNTAGEANTASGYSALYRNTTGHSNTATGSGALSANTTGSYNTGIGSFADVSAEDLTNATAIGYMARVDASNKIRLGNTAVTVIEGQVAFTYPSDSTKKENHRVIDGEEVLANLKDMRVGSWNYKGQDPGKFRHYGPMAQEFFSAFGRDGVGVVGNDTTICSGDLAGISLIALQALEKRTAELREKTAELEAVKSELNDLKARLALLEQALPVSKDLTQQTPIENGSQR